MLHFQNPRLYVLIRRRDYSRLAALPGRGFWTRRNKFSHLVTALRVVSLHLVLGKICLWISHWFRVIFISKETFTLITIHWGCNKQPIVVQREKTWIHTINLCFCLYIFPTFPKKILVLQVAYFVWSLMSVLISSLICCSGFHEKTFKKTVLLKNATK